MTAPRRWKDTHDAPVGVRELLSAARPPRAIDGATFERGATRVARLGAAPAAAAAGVAIGIWTKLAAAAVIGVAGVGAVAAVKHVVAADAERAVLERAEADTTVQAKARAQAAEADSSAVADAEADAVASAKADAVASAKADADAEAEAKAKAKAKADAVASAKATAAAKGGALVGVEMARAGVPRAGVASTVELGAETKLLEEARAALAHDPTTTLARVAQHRARFPSGVLGAERDLIELDALRRSGRTSEARANAAAWLEREPAGLHAPRVRAILASLGL